MGPSQNSNNSINGQGQNYIETDVAASRVARVCSSRTKNDGLQIKGDVPLENAQYF